VIREIIPTTKFLRTEKRYKEKKEVHFYVEWSWDKFFWLTFMLFHFFQIFLAKGQISALINFIVINNVVETLTFSSHWKLPINIFSSSYFHWKCCCTGKVVS